MISSLFLISFFGVLIGGILALFSNENRWHWCSQSVVIVSGLFGTLASVLFLVSGDHELLIASSPFFFGMSFGISPLGALFFLLVSMIGAIASFFGTEYINLEREKYNPRTTHFLTAIFLFGMQGVLLSGNPLGFMTFWEVMSMASFFLVMADRSEASVKAALFYLIMAHLGAGAILAGFLLLSQGDVFLSFSEITESLHNTEMTEFLLPILLLLFGFSSKAGLWPFHPWLPEAHPQAPSHVSALMSGVMLKIAIYGVFLVLLEFSPSLPFWMGVLFLSLGLLSALTGALRAVVSVDIKQILAFSSIENIGLIFIMLGIFVIGKASGMEALSSVAMIATLVHIVAHALFKSGLFLGSGCVVSTTHTRNIEELGGLAARMPKTSSALMLLSLSAAALPPFGVFLSEWLLLQVLVTSFPLAPLLVKFLLILTIVSIALISGLAIFAMVRFFGIGFLAAPRSHGAETAKDPSFFMWIPLWGFALGILCLGICIPLFLFSSPLIGGFQGVFSSEMLSLAGSLSGLKYLSFLLLLLLGGVFLIRRIFSKASKERNYHTWDCGQPIDATMEYTGTAFAAPAHFFFLQILGSKKMITATPVIETNPWICTRKMSFEVFSPIMQWGYKPIEKMFLFLSIQLHKIQNGIIQVYIGMIFLALIISILISL